MSTPITEAAGLPVSDPTPIVSYSQVVLKVPGRTVDLEIKVSTPVADGDLPVILLSHGHGPSTFISSLHGYGPLADFWAAHGFAVIQPSHLDSGALGLRDADDPDAPLYWRSRATDMHHILDHLDDIEATVPGLSGRLDRSRIAAAGHSLGGHTTSMLLGMRVPDPDEGAVADLTDVRVKAGVVLAGPGNGDDLAAWASENYPVLRHTDFSSMTTPALVIAGDQDLNPMFSDRISYRSDAYSLSPGPKSLLTLFGAEHMLGGVSGYDAAETTDENPERVAALRAIAWAYLRTQLYPGDSAFADATAALAKLPNAIGTVESK